MIWNDLISIRRSKKTHALYQICRSIIESLNDLKIDGDVSTEKNHKNNHIPKNIPRVILTC